MLLCLQSSRAADLHVATGEFAAENIISESGEKVPIGSTMAGKNAASLEQHVNGSLIFPRNVFQ